MHQHLKPNGLHIHSKNCPVRRSTDRAIKEKILVECQHLTV